MLKKFYSVMLCFCIFALATACSFRDSSKLTESSETEISNSASRQQEIVNSSESSAAPLNSQESDMSNNADKLNPEIPDGYVKTEFVIKSNDSDAMTKLLMYLPENWTVEGNEIYEAQRKVAEVLSLSIIDDESKPFVRIDSQYADSIATGNFALGLNVGKYYHLQSEQPENGITVKHNEIVYYLNREDKLIGIAFYPAYGIGIGTQREEFELLIKNIEIM